VGHAKAARRNRLSDRLRLVGAMNAIERRAQIHRARAERIFDAAGHVARQVGAAAQHLRRWGPARPFLLRGNAVGSTPAEAVPAAAKAVAPPLAARQYWVEPPFAGVDQDGAGRIIGLEHHGAARDRAAAAIATIAAAAEVRSAAQDVARVKELRL